MHNILEIFFDFFSLSHLLPIRYFFCYFFDDSNMYNVIVRLSFDNRLVCCELKFSSLYSRFLKCYFLTDDFFLLDVCDYRTDVSMFNKGVVYRKKFKNIPINFLDE